MPVLTITTDYDGAIRHEIAPDLCTYVKQDAIDDMAIGYAVVFDKVTYEYKFRGYIRFPLTELPPNANVTQVRLKVYCNTASASSTHYLDVHAYDTNGQTDPEPDAGATLFNRCASGNLYYNDGINLQSTNTKWITLGGTVCEDVEKAKTAVNRFSLGLHEEGDDDDDAWLDQLDKVGGVPAELEITYEVPPPVVGYQYSDGLVTVRVGG